MGRSDFAENHTSHGYSVYAAIHNPFIAPMDIIFKILFSTISPQRNSSISVGPKAYVLLTSVLDLVITPPFKRNDFHRTEYAVLGQN